MNYLWHVLFVAVAVLLSAKIVPGLRVRSFWSAVVFAFLLGIVNKVLLVFMFPFVLLTLGLAIFVVNAIGFLLVDKVVKGVEVDGFGSALLASIFTSLISVGLHWVLGAAHLH